MSLIDKLKDVSRGDLILLENEQNNKVCGFVWDYSAGRVWLTKQNSFDAREASRMFYTTQRRGIRVTKDPITPTHYAILIHI